VGWHRFAAACLPADSGRAADARAPIAAELGSARSVPALAFALALALADEFGVLLGIKFEVEKLAGSAAVDVVEDLGAFDDVGLPGVVGRHGDAAGGEALVEAGEQLGAAMQWAAEGGGDGLAGEVVLGGAEASHKDDDIGTRERNASNVHQVTSAIAHNGFETYFHAEPVQLRGKEERVRVLAERSQQFRSDGDDLSVHVSSLNERKALHAPGEMENSVGGDQDRCAIPRECQPNQTVSGDDKTGMFLWSDFHNTALAA